VTNQERLEQLAKHLEDIGDPSAPVVRSHALRGAIEQQRDDRVEEMLETAERIAGGAIAAKAAGELPRAIDRLTRERDKWRTLFTAAGALGLLLAGFGMGWWDRGPHQIVAGVSGGTPRCDPAILDGSRLCWIPVYERPPPDVAPAEPQPAQSPAATPKKGR
jgi:hypothetical protein